MRYFCVLRILWYSGFCWHDRKMFMSWRKKKLFRFSPELAPSPLIDNSTRAKICQNHKCLCFKERGSRKHQLCELLLSVVMTRPCLRGTTQCKRTMNFHIIFWAIIPIGCNKAHTLNYTHPRINSPKNCMLSVQKWSWFQCDEKLTSICIWTGICHWHNTSPNVFQVSRYFIFEFSSIDALSASTCSRGITTLNHEIFDNSMKNCAIVVTGLC